jgi:large subunit ribosomal protein L29
MAAKKNAKQVVKKSQVNQIRELNDADIQAKIAELKQELFNLRFQAAVGKLENTAQLRKVKKEIARAYTVLTERAGKEA